MASSVTSTLAEIFPGESEMAQLMRAHNWADTALGEPDSWPDGLKIPLKMLLTSRFEMWLGWGPDLCFFYNDAYIPTMGLKHPSMLGHAFKKVWAEVYEDVADQVALVAEGGASWNKALRLLLERRGYREETYHSFSYSPLYGASGSVEGLLCVVTEETERVIADRRLEILRKLGLKFAGPFGLAEIELGIREVLGNDQEDFPFALLELQSPDGIATVGSTADIANMDDHNWPILAPGEDLRLVKLDPKIDWPRGAWQIPPSQALIVGLPNSGEEASYGQLVLGLSPYRRRDDDSVIEFARLIAGLLSGALANMASLAAERRRADRIWLHGRDLVLVINQVGVILTASPAWNPIVGLDPLGMVGENIRDLVHPDDVEGAMEAFELAAIRGSLTSYESRVNAADGSSRWIAWNTAMEDGLVYAYGRDISEQKARSEALQLAEDALRQAQKMEAIGQLTGGVAHDFNNLLTVIRSSAELLRKSDLSEGKRDRYLDAITTTSDRAAKLTSQLLAFARRQSLTPEVFDTAERIRSIADMLRTLLGANISLELVMACQPDNCLVRADISQFETAVVNMTVNARDAMERGGSLTIEVKNVSSLPASSGQIDHQGPFLAIALKDTGEGIEPDILGKIFEPFFTTKNVGRGTGLGLSQVYGFAKQSGGDLQVESTLGSGTAFTLYLPRVAGAQVAPGVAISKAETITGSGRVLVVEDNAEVGEFASQILEDIGYSTILASNAALAIKILEREADTIDLIFSDVVMPGMSGIELGREVQKRWPTLPFILTSGYSHTLAKDSDHGFPLLRKPYSIEELSQLLHSVQDCGAKLN